MKMIERVNNLQIKKNELDEEFQSIVDDIAETFTKATGFGFICGDYDYEKYYYFGNYEGGFDCLIKMNVETLEPIYITTENKEIELKIREVFKKGFDI